MEFISQHDTDELDDASEEEVSFGCKDIGSFSVGDPQSVFQRTNGSFHAGTAGIDLSKGRIVAGDARI